MEKFWGSWLNGISSWCFSGLVVYFEIDILGTMWVLLFTFPLIHGLCLVSHGLL